MKKKGFTAEQIIGKLREAEVLLGQGSTVGEPVKQRTGESLGAKDLCPFREGQIRG